MKFLGAGLVWLSLTMTGVYLSARLKKRREILESIIVMLEHVYSEIKYLMKPLGQIICEMSEDTRFLKLAFIGICSEQINNGSDFPMSWQVSVENCNLPLKCEEMLRLTDFGKGLGKSDIEGQDGLFRIYHEFFLSFYKSAAEEEKKYGSFVIVTGFLCGCALFILII